MRRRTVLLLLTSTWLLGFVQGNTEIEHFTPDAARIHAEPSAVTSIAAALNMSLLHAPYTSIESVSLATLESSHPAEDQVNWYCLKDIDPRSSYEIRISYAATEPANYSISLFYAQDVLAMHNITAQEEGGSSGQMQRIMYAKVNVSYAGVSNRRSVQNMRVLYNIVLEKHVAGLPIQALKLIVVIVTVAVSSVLVVAPRVMAIIDEVLEEEGKGAKQQ
ncbi:hypothetical protein GQ54DRAFT_299390 [Martensiomyces pterosporus]|nr:hypothetical protein GQ54DRAFT_299390 [Martensiomyces pterosporus]